MWHPTIKLCRKQLFPYIRKRMADAEPAPFYEKERSGVDALEGILILSRRNEYPDILLANGKRIHITNMSVVHEELEKRFPNSRGKTSNVIAH
jgi:hypothetical protein